MPSGSLDVEASSEATRFATVLVNAATGAWFTGGAVTVTLAVVRPVAPLSSVTVNATV